MSVGRVKKLHKDEDFTAKNVEEIFDELTSKIPDENEFRVNLTVKEMPGKKIPSGMKEGEIRWDVASWPPHLIVPLRKPGDSHLTLCYIPLSIT